MVASVYLVSAFFALALIVLFGFLAALHVSSRSGASGAGPGETRAALIALAWVAVTGALAAAGVLSFSSPTMPLVLVAGFALSVTFALSRTGRRVAAVLPMWVLVGFQAFRFPLELLMHRAYEEGVMPVQMSYSGLNLDIVTGVTALILGVALALRPVSAAWVRAWNALGVLLLANILVVALLSAPLPIRVFMNEPANTWVTEFPFVWLPAVLVQAAVIGHFLVFHRLRADALARQLAEART